MLSVCCPPSNFDTSAINIIVDDSKYCNDYLFILLYDKMHCFAFPNVYVNHKNNIESASLLICAPIPSDLKLINYSINGHIGGSKV